MIRKPGDRLLSLDVLRGITIAGMIMVNNPGSWKYVCEPLGHAAWHGLTPTDLVFPFFMFIMGISTYISLNKFNFECNRPALLKILKRTIVIFVIGLGLGWLSLSFRTYHSLGGEDTGLYERLLQSITNFGHIRIPGVMQRLAITYGATALIAISVKHRYIPRIIVATLTGYFLLLLFGNGFEFSENNIVSVLDRAVLGADHMYRDSGLSIDPEGLLSTVPAICHVLTGFCCGRVLLAAKDNDDRVKKLFVIGAILAFLGFLLGYGCPVNKKIWSPTFVSVTCGLAATSLALLIWVIDIKGYKRWSAFFESFGVNPLFIYVAAGVFSIILGNILFTYNGSTQSIKNFIYQACMRPCLGDYPGSLAYALLFVGFNRMIGNILYKKKIYIKI
ncbi:MAG: heparan-alpha-glucosaminide N-acetyltransferase domain-containing protein [Prevotella sp.]|jgi:predicted acyltransferase|nr:heparan-alpha-glucosaminide N-acetyltransferase domain-containing protein [Prevotella sp.]